MSTSIGAGRLDIAVLRSRIARDLLPAKKSDPWVSVASVPLPRGAYNHFLAVDLGGHQPATDFVLFGPAGLLVIESRAAQGEGKTLADAARRLGHTPLADATKNALSVVALDLNEDGLNDLVVACQTPNSAAAALHVLRNEGNRHFRDITARSGLANIAIGPGSLTAVDWDNDLDVDLIAPALPPSSAIAHGHRIFQRTRPGAVSTPAVSREGRRSASLRRRSPYSMRTRTDRGTYLPVARTGCCCCSPRRSNTDASTRSVWKPSRISRLITCWFWITTTTVAPIS